MLSSNPSLRWLFGLVIALFLLQSLQYLSRMNLDDDNLYLSYMSEARAGKPVFEQQETGYLKRLQAVPGCEITAQRFAFRAGYHDNYPSLPVVESLIRARFDPGIAAATWVAGPPLLARAAIFLIAFALLLVTLWRSRNRELLAAVLVGLAALAMLDVVLNLAYYVLRGQDYGYLGKVAYHMGKWQMGGSLLQHTPRNTAALLFMLALVLKWNGHIRQAILVVIAVTLVHRTYATLEMLLLTGLLLFSAREALRESGTRALMLLGLATILSRELYWSNPAAAVRWTALAVLAYAALLWAGSNARLDPLFRFAAGKARPAGALPIDAMLLICAYGFLCLLKLAGVALSGELFHRIPTLCLAPIVVGLVAGWILNRPAVSTYRVALTTTVLALPFLLTALLRTDWQAWPRHEERVKQLLSLPSDEGFNASADEARVYLALLSTNAPAALGLPVLSDWIAAKKLYCQGGERGGTGPGANP